MIEFEKTEIWGFEHAIRGMRNPMNSWNRMDSTEDEFGKNDTDLMKRLIRGGAPHRKFLRQIYVSVDITAPLYWWKEFDTYKVGVTANSCSTMHKIHAKELTLEDFSFEHLIAVGNLSNSVNALNHTIKCINFWRDAFNMKEDERTEYFQYNGYPFVPTKRECWQQMIQLLPSSYNQKRTVTMTYENLLNILEYRLGHKLDEWRKFCEWIMTLKGSELLKEGFDYEQK